MRLKRLIFFQKDGVFEDLLSEIYWFAIPTCFSWFFFPDVCMFCMAAFCNMAVAESLVPCLFHQLIKQNNTFYLIYQRFHALSSPPFSSPALFLHISIFCWGTGADGKVLCAWLRGICGRCHWSLLLVSSARECTKYFKTEARESLLPKWTVKQEKTRIYINSLLICLFMRYFTDDQIVEKMFLSLAKSSTIFKRIPYMCCFDCGHLLLRLYIEMFIKPH